MHLCNHNANQELEHFHHPQSSLMFFCSHLTPTTGPAQLLICFMSRWISFAFFRISYKWNSFSVYFFCIYDSSFAQHIVLNSSLFSHILVICSFLFLSPFLFLLYKNTKIFHSHIDEHLSCCQIWAIKNKI